MFLHTALSRALAAGLPFQDHVWIAVTTEQFVRFHKKDFDEMQLSKLDSTENPCSFNEYPTLE